MRTEAASDAWDEIDPASPSDGGYDALAASYDGWTRLAFGRRLERFRHEALTRGFAHAVDIRDDPRGLSVAILGDGRGHCARWLLENRICKTLILVDRSQAMLQIAAETTRACMPLHPTADVRLRHADARDGLPIRERIDVWILPFVLDCFAAEELERLLQRLREHAHAATRYVVIDFAKPEGNSLSRSAWGRVQLWAMHRFFRWRTDLPNRRLLDLPRATSRAFGHADWQCRRGSILWAAGYGSDASSDNRP